MFRLYIFDIVPATLTIYNIVLARGCLLVTNNDTCRVQISTVFFRQEYRVIVFTRRYDYRYILWLYVHMLYYYNSKWLPPCYNSLHTLVVDRAVEISDSLSHKAFIIVTYRGMFRLYMIDIVSATLTIYNLVLANSWLYSTIKQTVLNALILSLMISRLFDQHMFKVFFYSFF